MKLIITIIIKYDTAIHNGLFIWKVITCVLTHIMYTIGIFFSDYLYNTNRKKETGNSSRKLETPRIVKEMRNNVNVIGFMLVFKRRKQHIVSVITCNRKISVGRDFSDVDADISPAGLTSALRRHTNMKMD